MSDLQDQFGNYAPQVTTDAATWDFTTGPSLSGSGVPTGDPGVPFATYTDTATGHGYFWNGSAWTAMGASVEDSFRSGNFSGGQPNFTPPGTYGGAKDTSNGVVWIYTLAGGWE